MGAEAPFQPLRLLWARIATGYPGYAAVLPGDPAFLCQAQRCEAWCCRNLTVPIGDADAGRLAGFTGLPLSRLVESEDGVPLRLPLVDPYVLARRDGGCAHLGGDDTCTVYDGRPSACRLYPHQILFFDDSGRPAAVRDPHAAVEALLNGEPGGVTPVLVRHLPCPGFTGPPLSARAWAALAREVAAVQFGAG